MKCLCNVKCRLVKDVDMFGKEPELYYKGRTKKTSWMGRLFSFSFVIVYFAFFIYKLIRMLKKTDVTFYDTFTYAPTPPAVPITSDNFYVAFALEDPYSYDAFVNESIYTVKASFKRAEMKGEEFEWQVHDLDIERCKLEKFGKTYQDAFKNIKLENYYCFKDINNFVLEGHFSCYLYSFFYIQFFPCINDTDPSIPGKCAPLNDIDYYLKNTFVTLEMEDIELTPKNYHSPVRPRSKDVYTTVGKKLFQEIHAFFEVVEIQTDLDWVGFDEFENLKSEKYLKYDETFIMSNVIEDDIYETGEPICDLTIKLSENVRTQRRIYTKFVTILGDVGGFMEVIFTLFRIASSFSIDILYEISMVNRLFKFNTNKKDIILKIGEDEISKIDFKENDFNANEIKVVNMKKNLNFSGRKKTKVFSSKQNNIYNMKSNNDINRLNLSSSKSKSNLPDVDIESSRTINGKFKLENNQKANEENIYNNYFPHQQQNQHKSNIISKVRLNRACVYLWFCFVRRRKIIHNILLDEGMDLISQRLDIFNIFEKIYKAELRNEKITNRIIPMSDECKTRLKILETEWNGKDTV